MMAAILLFGFGGPWDIAIVAGVVVLLFGGSKLPIFAKSLGEGMKEFKKAAREISSDDHTETTAQPQSSAPRMMENTQPGAAAISDGTTHTAEATAAVPAQAHATKE